MNQRTATQGQSLLQEHIQGLEKRYGKGVVMRLGESKVVDVLSISTGSLGLDKALGVGGLPCGRIVEIYGPESTGKTTLALHAIAETQKKGGTAVLIDSEHAFDEAYAQALGIVTKDLFISQPDHGEQALDIADNLIRSGEVDMVVIDSVAALVPKSELTGELGELKVGAQARLMSQALRRLTGIIHKTGAICIFINQLRQKIGVMFGNPETTPGGNALKFYASVRIDVRRGSQIKEGDVAIGHLLKAKVVKNKVGAPFKVAQMDLIYGKGISKMGELADLAIGLELIKRSGAWFSYGEKKIGQGKQAMLKWLACHPDICNELYKKVR
jgi:recombination protein RecA